MDEKVARSFEYLRGCLKRDPRALNVLEYLCGLWNIDGLTGLPQMKTFKADVLTECSRFGRGGKSFAVMFADVDDFKKVNDRYGHQAGDGVLKTIANRLVSGKRNIDRVYRYAGDEFSGIYPVDNRAHADVIATRSLDRVVAPGICVGKDSLLVTISVGIYLAKRGERWESVIKRADEAMYRAKGAGGNRVSF